MSGAAVSRNLAVTAASKTAACRSIIQRAIMASVESAANKISATVAANRDILETAANTVVDGARAISGTLGTTASNIVDGDAPNRGILGTTESDISDGDTTNTGILCTAASDISDGDAPSRGILATAMRKIADTAATGIAMVKNGVSRAIALTTAVVVGVVLGFVACSILAGTSAVPAPPAASDGSSIAGILAVMGGATVAVIGLPLMLPALGFGAGGVAAGSIAAAIQGMMGNVAAGGIFAFLQSTGVVGVALSTKVGLGSAGAAIGAAFAYLSNK